MEQSGFEIVFPFVMLAIFFVFVAGIWRTFSKAGKPGWASIVPFYNGIVMLQIAGRPLWWLLLMFIPMVNMIIMLIVVIDIAKAFGKGAGFGLGLFFMGPIFYPILGFGSAQHQGAPTH